ncbi:hypothetical protein Taro_050689, partial [Colocasia esculenta]|nr:hypothetical protein [Colocasia esculenta]
MDLQLCVYSCLTCSHGAAVGPFVRDCETERLFLCCVVRSVPVWWRRSFPTRTLPLAVAREFVTRGRGLSPFEVCPSVGTVVTAVVACGVPEWWHSFGYG